MMSTIAVQAIICTTDQRFFILGFDSMVTENDKLPVYLVPYPVKPVRIRNKAVERGDNAYETGSRKAG